MTQIIRQFSGNGSQEFLKKLASLLPKVTPSKSMVYLLPNLNMQGHFGLIEVAN